MRVFNEPSCVGSHFIFERSERCYTGSLLNQGKSFTLEDGDSPANKCIWVYNTECVTGMKVEICADVENLVKLRFDNKVGSIKLGPGVKAVRVFADPYYKGIEMKFSFDFYSFADGKLYQNIESIKFEY
jgi:hypothetical protein